VIIIYQRIGGKNWQLFFAEFGEQISDVIAKTLENLRSLRELIPNIDT